MAYTPTYVSTDLSKIVIDFLGTFGANWVPFAGILAIAVIALWVKAHF